MDNAEPIRTKTFQTKSVIILSIILVLILLNYFGLISKFFDIILIKSVNTSNIAYLDKISNKSVELFAALSTYKALVAIIEGSGAGIEFGNIVKSINDFIDITWKTVLFSIVSINIQKLFINDLAVPAFKYILMAALALFLISQIIAMFPKIKFYKPIKNLAGLLLSIALIIYLLMPFVIYLGSNISDKVITGKIDSSIEKIKTDTESAKQIKLVGWRVDKLIKDAYAFASQLLKSSTETLFWIITCFLLDCFIMPILLMLAFYYLIKYIFYQVIILR